jgi:hypothetical protein
MSTNFQKVRDFNISFGIGRSKTPDDKLFKLRWDLIQEESNELFEQVPNEINGEIVIEDRNNRFNDVVFTRIKSIEEINILRGNKNNAKQEAETIFSNLLLADDGKTFEF